MAKQGREVDGKGEWTEASVWTERMLATLERGIKGGKWYSLIDHKLWPNAYFMSLGLFSLATARATESQSRKRKH